MTPAARFGAAIEILDQWIAGSPLEKALTNWGRRSRYAGSKDRAAVRDIVFGCVRRKAEYAEIGGPDGRGLVLGSLRTLGLNEAQSAFAGGTYAPAPISEDEIARVFRAPLDLSAPAQLNMPDWVIPELERSLGENTKQVCEILGDRAPTFLRVNLKKTSVVQAKTALAKEGIETQTHELSDAALEVTLGARKIANSGPYQNGWVELQDLSSQIVASELPIQGRVLDYCAGGGGKALSLAARGENSVYATDISGDRLNDLPSRARRAGAQIKILDFNAVETHAPFDVVFCDAPCSGSGAWRRNPETKWSLDQDKLDKFNALQDEVLANAKALVAPGGILAYATCSLLKSENQDRVKKFLTDNPKWTFIGERILTPLDGGDGFYVAKFTNYV